jgi:WhiB family redox-sensing transcriptional regulator
MADFSRLPGPNADLWDWQLHGLCRGKDSSLFFHPEGERGAARSSRESAAKEICMNCPVQISCADHALKVREPYGVWGGLTEEEREEHHARQKALVRAQAAREKAAKLQQERLKEKLLREKALQNLEKERALAAAGAKERALQETGTRTVRAASAATKAKPAEPITKKPVRPKKAKALVKA